MYGGADADSARDEMNSSQRAACPSHSGSRGVFDLALRKVCPSFNPHDLSPSFNFPFQIERDKGGQRRHGPKKLMGPLLITRSKDNLRMVWSAGELRWSFHFRS